MLPEIKCMMMMIIIIDDLACAHNSTAFTALRMRKALSLETKTKHFVVVYVHLCGFSNDHFVCVGEIWRRRSEKKTMKLR